MEDKQTECVHYPRQETREKGERKHFLTKEALLTDVYAARVVLEVLQSGLVSVELEPTLTPRLHSFDATSVFLLHPAWKMQTAEEESKNENEQRGANESVREKGVYLHQQRRLGSLSVTEPFVGPRHPTPNQQGHWNELERTTQKAKAWDSSVGRRNLLLSSASRQIAEQQVAAPSEADSTKAPRRRLWRLCRTN